MIKGPAEEGREARSGRHRNHREGEHARQCLALEEIAGDGAREHESRTDAKRLKDTPGDQHRKAGGKRTKDASGNENDQAAEDKSPSPEPIRKGADEVKGDFIAYDAKTGFYQVMGGPSVATPVNPKGRVRATIQPPKKSADKLGGVPGGGLPVPLKPSTSLPNNPEP